MLDLIDRLLSKPSGGVSDEVLYVEHCAEFRALNTLFWQIPVLVTTLSGGLWFAVASLGLTDAGRSAVLWFSAAVNVAFFIALWRLRVIMDGLLKQIRRFEGRPTKPGVSFIVLGVFFALMMVTSMGAGIVALNPSRFLVEKTGEGVLLCTQTPGALTTCRVLKP